MSLILPEIYLIEYLHCVSFRQPHFPHTIAIQTHSDMNVVVVTFSITVLSEVQLMKLVRFIFIFRGA